MLRSRASQLRSRSHSFSRPRGCAAAKLGNELASGGSAGAGPASQRGLPPWRSALSLPTARGPPRALGRRSGALPARARRRPPQERQASPRAAASAAGCSLGKKRSMTPRATCWLQLAGLPGERGGSARARPPPRGRAGASPGAAPSKSPSFRWLLFCHSGAFSMLALRPQEKVSHDFAPPWNGGKVKNWTRVCLSHHLTTQTTWQRAHKASQQHLTQRSYKHQKLN